MNNSIKEILDKYGLKYDNKRIKNIENIINYFGEISYNELENIILENYTIGESYFFRDKDLWKILKQFFLRDKKQTYNVLSLGCSRGEEVYTFSFIINDTDKDYKITGVDASFERIKQAKEGKYKKWSVRKLTKSDINKYFEKKGDYYFVKDKFKKHIEFETANITNYIKNNDKYDIIFLRRVLIYFTEMQIKSILKNIKSSLNDNGLLILGHGEFYPYLTKLFDYEITNNIVLWKKTNKEATENFKTKKTIYSNNKIIKEKKSYNLNNEKLIDTLSNIPEEEYLEIIEKLISEKNYAFAYNLINKISDNSLNYLIWKYKAFLEIQLNLDPTDSLNKAIFLNSDDDELWALKRLNGNRR